MRRPSAAVFLGLVLLPGSVALTALAFRIPDAVERFYGNFFYPLVARGLGAASAKVPFSLAEAGVAMLGAGLLIHLVRSLRKRAGYKRLLLTELVRLAALAGGILFAFIVLWGLNYARPKLETKLRLVTENVSERELLTAGHRAARQAAVFYSQLDADPESSTVMPLSLEALDDVLDDELARLSLPGHSPGRLTSRAKMLFSSRLFCYLGISGIFIPFTSEPSVNGMLPDCSLPLVIAHEKAHQLGVANEGEASLVGFLACARSEGRPYLRYAAYLEATSELAGAVSRRRPEEARLVLESLGPGPLLDLRAVRAFWARYEGRVSRGTSRVNDAYLKTFRVPGGVLSYGRVATLLVGLDRAGRLESP